MLIIRFSLIILTITAILQPIIFFYCLDNFIEPLIFGFIGLIVTTFFIIYNLTQKERYRRLNLIWSILICIIGLITFQIPTTWIYVADALIFMNKREAVVQNIKESNFDDNKRVYHHKSLLPVSVKNKIEIKKFSKQDFEIKFKILDLSFLGIFEKGVLYTDQPKMIQTYEKATEEAGGVITESSFRIRKIKQNWYFYEYESQIIHD
jgi:hypothetical protein